MSVTQATAPIPPAATEFNTNLGRRHRIGRFWLLVFQASTVVGIIALAALLITIVNSAFGYIVMENKVDPASLAVNGVPLEELPKEDLTLVLQENVSKGLFRRFENDMPFEERSREEIYDLIVERVIEPEVVAPVDAPGVAVPTVSGEGGSCRTVSGRGTAL